MKRTYQKPETETLVCLHLNEMVAKSNPWNFGEGKDTDFEDDEELSGEDFFEDDEQEKPRPWFTHDNDLFHTDEELNADC